MELLRIIRLERADHISMYKCSLVVKMHNNRGDGDAVSRAPYSAILKLRPEYYSNIRILGARRREFRFTMRPSRIRVHTICSLASHYFVDQALSNFSTRRVHII